MATDPWYVRELLADVPAEEYHAAVEDENWSDGDEGEEGDESEDEEEGEESDRSYSEEEEEDSSDGADSNDEGWDSMDTDAELSEEPAELPEEPATSRYVPRSPSGSPPATFEGREPGARSTTPEKTEARQGV